VVTSGSRAWIPAALIVGGIYLFVGRVFALPADHVRAWRLAAWIVSGIAYAGQLWYEHFKLHSSSHAAAWHAAAAVALGAFALAVAGMIHSSSIRPAWLLALVAWPAFTAVPAYLVALAAGAVLALARR
jgi:hypothetical protein